jgi:hypothetical protein
MPLWSECMGDCCKWFRKFVIGKAFFAFGIECMRATMHSNALLAEYLKHFTSFETFGIVRRLIFCRISGPAWWSAAEQGAVPSRFQFLCLTRYRNIVTNVITTTEYTLIDWKSV